MNNVASGIRQRLERSRRDTTYAYEQEKILKSERKQLIDSFNELLDMVL